MRSNFLLVSFLVAPQIVGADGQLNGTTDATATLQVVSSIQPDHTASELWIDGTSIAIGAETARAAGSKAIPVSDDGTAWVGVLHDSLQDIQRRASELTAMLDAKPIETTIVVGNRASSDAFGWVPNFIGVNVHAFADSYGPPDDGAADRMARIVLHEYLHLLTYANYPNHADLRQTPIDRALWTIFFEGIGDYVSMSERWFPDPEGTPSATAREALHRLEPEFVTNLERLMTANEKEERTLRRGISMGRFDQKWGSLPFALWLRQETAVCDETETLRKILDLERSSILPLAMKHANPKLRSRLQEIAGQWAGNAVTTNPTNDFCVKDL